VRLRRENNILVLEAEYNGGEYVELCREPDHVGPISHEVRVWPPRENVKVKSDP
jgi:hypothetical protein